VIYRGPLGGAARAKALGSARALLHLINFDEPFGLSVVEALACGTPVIASNRGSMPELIVPGVTGFLVDSVDEAVDAIGCIGDLDRAACRTAASARFRSTAWPIDIWTYTDRFLADDLLGLHWPSSRCSVAVRNGTLSSLESADLSARRGNSAQARADA
jgi:hypothetical protein